MIIKTWIDRHIATKASMGACMLSEIDELRAALAAWEKQEPAAWAVEGSSQIYRGEYAHDDAESEARHCGGTCAAYPLYTKPKGKL